MYPRIIEWLRSSGGITSGRRCEARGRSKPAPDQKRLESLHLLASPKSHELVGYRSFDEAEHRPDIPRQQGESPAEEWRSGHLIRRSGELPHPNGGEAGIERAATEFRARHA